MVANCALILDHLRAYAALAAHLQHFKSARHTRAVIAGEVCRIALLFTGAAPLTAAQIGHSKPGRRMNRQ